MKQILIATTALVSLSLGASAADLPRRNAPAPYLAAPIFTWTGFYVGLNAGAAFGNSASTVVTPGPVLVGLGDKTSFVGGAQIGYNYQISNFVLGLEGDIDYLDQKRSALVGGVTFRTRASYLGTVRARAGYAFDRALLYVTGGVAFSDLKNSSTGALLGSSSSSVGYTVGGGLEYAITNNWSAKAEYLYTHFDGKSYRAGVNTITPKDTNLHVVRLGVNYKF